MSFVGWGALRPLKKETMAPASPYCKVHTATEGVATVVVVVVAVAVAVAVVVVVIVGVAAAAVAAKRAKSSAHRAGSCW
jgi:hypothetical protein